MRTRNSAISWWPGQRLTCEPTSARVIKQPIIKKFGVELPLCTPEGVETRLIRKQDAAAFKAVRKLDWGDSFD